jgi:TatD DNase family protein
MSLYIDTHCHLDLFSNPSQTLDEAPETVVVVVTGLPSGYRVQAVRFRGDKRVRVALGLHPLKAATAGALEVGQLVRQLPNAEYVGEVGLDFSAHGKDTKTAQLRVFDRLLAEPTLRHKVVSIHSRGAESVVLERLQAAGVVGILHWYTGPLGLIDTALDAGLYFSINPAMLRSEKGRKVIVALPHDRILTESDGPFAKAHGHSAGPADMKRLVSDVADFWQTTPDTVRDQVYDNLAFLYAATVRSSPKS